MFFTEPEWRMTFKAMTTLRNLLDCQEIKPPEGWLSSEKEAKIRTVEAILDKIGQWGKALNRSSLDFQEVETIIDSLEILHIIYTRSLIIRRRVDPKERYNRLKTIRLAASKFRDLCRLAIA